RIGSDGNNIKYVGGSQAVDFRGRIVGRCSDSTEEAKVITLSKYALESNREKAPVWKDAD
ncbi:MAG: nitrilase family protein, partial [Paludibacteraceae bacterium]|nr:nitrilase family protein [Paludibacteraceae bacterium]